MMPHSTRAAMMRFSTLDPSLWPACLDALRALDFNAIDVPLVWREHETPDGTFDFVTARLRVGALLDAIAERGMRALVRLGPMCALDAPGLGLPERVLRDRECQARTRRQNPVVIPDPPRLVPLPSLASQKYRAECARWVSAASEALAPHLARGTISHLALGHGPEAMRRDDALEFDHHPDAQALDPEVPNGPGANRAAVERETALAVGFLEHLAQAAVTHGFSGYSLRLSVSGSVLMSCVARALMGDYGLSCGLPLPESGSESVWRHARAIASMPRPAHVDLRVGCHPWETARRASYTTPAARIALAAGLRHTTAVMGVSGSGWVGALLDERGAPRAHCPRWKSLNHFAETLATGEDLGVEMALPRERVAEARARTGLRPLSLGLLGLRDVLPGEFYGEDELRAIERDLTDRAVPWRLSLREGAHAVGDFGHLTPTLDPPGAALVRAVQNDEGVALVLVASRDVEVRVTPPPGRWTDVEGRDLAGLAVMPGECATMLQSATESEVRW